MIVARWLQTLLPSTFRRWIRLMAVLLFTGLSIQGWSQNISTQDYSRITQVPRAEMDTWLKQEVAASGGNWNKDRYHFYIGFSTGHFGQDPVHAIAMRRLAFNLMNNSLAVGDRVTPIAWEMKTWNVGSSVTLTNEAASRTEFVNGVPYAPHAGSQGGHDIERVLYETITKAIPPEEIHSAIVILLTNSNASQAPTGERASLFGADNPQLAEAIRQGMFRLPPSRKEFQLHAGEQSVTVALTALFPQKLTSLSDAPNAPRYPTFARETWQPLTDRPAATEILPNLVRPDTSYSSGISGWVGGVAALVAVMVVVFLLRSYSRKSLPLKTAKRAGTATLLQPTAYPGSLTVTIGPDAQTLQPLTSASRWILLRDEAGKVTLTVAPTTSANTTGNRLDNTEGDASQAIMPLAELAFDEKRHLRIEAVSGVKFIELQGTAASQSDSRLLLLGAGKRAFCRVQPPDTNAKIRFEVVYDAQKGSQV